MIPLKPRNEDDFFAQVTAVVLILALVGIPAVVGHYLLSDASPVTTILLTAALLLVSAAFAAYWLDDRITARRIYSALALIWLSLGASALAEYWTLLAICLLSVTVLKYDFAIELKKLHPIFSA